MADEPAQPEPPSEPAPGAPEPHNAPEPTEPPDGDTEPLTALRREAAGYRTRLRDVEHERDQLAARVDQLERSEVERVAAGAGMSTPADIWLLVESLDELRVDGQLNPDRVTERVRTILQERPSWRAPQHDYGSGSRIGNGTGHRELGLFDLLRTKDRR
jgi:hypothetical protein